MANKRLSLIDIGSNSIRLVVFSIDEHYLVSELQNVKIPARIVQYLDDDDVMSEEGIKELVHVLDSLVRISRTYQPENEFYVATAAIRRSVNNQEIAERIKNEVGIEIKILSEEEEGYYGNYAVLHTMELRDGITVDIGGGSTELVLFKDKKVEKMVSLPFGGVSLQDDFFDGKDHNDKKAVKKATKWVQEQIEAEAWIKDTNVPLIGIGGSARNIAEVFQRRVNYPIAGLHCFELSLDNMEEVLSLFLSQTLEELDDLDGLSSDRKESIIPATIVFNQVLSCIGSDCFVISSKGLREGYLIEYMNETEPVPFQMDNVQGSTVVRAARKYRIPSVSVNQRVIIADYLLRELERNNLIELSERMAQYFYYGVTLYFVGAYIEDDAKSQHSFYILSNMNLNGFSHKDRVRVALIASFKNKSLFNQYMETFESWFTDEEKEILLGLGSIVKFAEALNDTHINQIEHLQLEPRDEGYELYIDYQGDVLSEMYRAEKQKNHFERVIGDDVTLVFIDK